MEQQAVPPPAGLPASAAISLGSGWLMPAALVTFLLATVYLPAHQDGASGIAGIVALAAALYAAGLVIAAPRLARSAVLRLAGRRFRVVLIGIGEDELGDPSIAGRWRMLAIAAGATVSLLTVVAALLLASRAPASAYPHAVAAVAANVALFSALGTLVPAPPFVGWSLVLTVLDLAGTPRAARLRRAARVGRVLATPLLVAGATLLAPLDPWMAIPLGALAVVYVWRATDLAVGRDALARFLEAHTVGQLARPPILRVRPDDAMTPPTLARRRPGGAVFVEGNGFLVVAIGTHRLRRAGTGSEGRPGAAWRSVMVPLARLPWLERSEPATSLTEVLRASGVVLVAAAGEIRAVEEDALLDQAAAWSRGGTNPSARRGAPPVTLAAEGSSDIDQG